MDYGYLISEYKLNHNALIHYGFQWIDTTYIYQKYLNDNDFYAIIKITDDSFYVKVYDSSLDEEYIPFTLKHANGSFVSSIKEDVLNVVEDIIEHCFDFDSMKEKVCAYVQNQYQTILECPFKESPAIAFKTKHKQKWYGLLMNIPYLSLGIEKEGRVDVLNLKNNHDKIIMLIDHKTYFPAYHMNKKYWISVLIDNSLKEKEIYRLIDESYKIVEK